MSVRTSNAVWKGSLRDGSGVVSLGSGAFSGAYTYASRFESGKGTNPEELIDLAAELGVSVRTMHRYFSMLDEMGIPVYSERGPQGGFSLVRGYRMPPLVLTPEESVSVYLGVGLVEEMWGQLYREAARGALAKLENILPDEQRREAAWARRSLVATGLHRSDQSGFGKYDIPQLLIRIHSTL